MTKTESEWSQAYRSLLPPPIVREVLVRYGSETNLQAGGYSPTQVRHFQKVLGRVALCRTGELGSAHFRCGDCGNGRLVPSPCGNRHCAGCSFVRSNNWKDDVLGWNVQCEYQHLVFTLPHLLNPWLRKYSRELYNLLIRSVRDVLLELHEKSFGCVPGALLTLHTWGQRMNQHVHVHVILTGGGLSLDGTRWVNVDHRSPLLSREALAAAFKQMFLRRLKRQTKRWLADESDTFDDVSATRLLHELKHKTWMVNNQSPPEGKSGPEAVVNYLARYVAGVAISDSRILSDDGTHVSFRCKNYQANTKTIERVTGAEFVQRFCLHILPKNFSRVRSIGLFRPQQRDARLALVRHLIEGQSFEEFQKQQAKAADNRVSPLSWTVPTVQLDNTTESEAASGPPSYIADEAKLLEWQLWKEQHTQARIEQWAPTTIEQDLQIAVHAILPHSRANGPPLALETSLDTGDHANQSNETKRCEPSNTQAARREPSGGSMPDAAKPDGSRRAASIDASRKTSLHGKRLGPSEWRSKYNGCRQCGEQMERVAQRSQHMTTTILKTVGKLLSLLSLMPWDVMVEFLQQLRAGRVDRSRWPKALQDAMVGTMWFDKWLYQAIYWYLIEQIAERLKSGELRNPKIYEFNPNVVYDPKRHCRKKCDKHEPKVHPSGIPPPGKKTSRKKA